MRDSSAEGDFGTLPFRIPPEVAFRMGREKVSGSAPAPRPYVLDTAPAPKLIVTEKNAAHVYGACSLCNHRLHAFIRGAEEEAMLLLNRGFKHHCRTRHEMVLSIPTKISTPRRSTRVAADVLIELQGERFAHAGETITVNLHGALVRIAAPIKLGDGITLYIHSSGRSANARVVFADDEAQQFGIELDSPENIWGMADPPSDWTESVF
jgi:hypothetical protein